MTKKKKTTKRRRPVNPMPVAVQVQKPQSYFQLVHPNGDTVRFTAANLKLAPTSDFIPGASDHTTLIAETEIVGTIIIAHFPGVLSTNQPATTKQEKK